MHKAMFIYRYQEKLKITVLGVLQTNKTLKIYTYMAVRTNMGETEQLN